MSDSIGTEKSSTGLDVNLAGALAYLALAVSGIVLLIIEKDSRFVRFHAMQSIAVGVVSIVLTLILVSSIIGLVLVPVLWLFFLLLWLFLMYKAYQGERYKLPFIGDFVEQQLK